MIVYAPTLLAPAQNRHNNYGYLRRHAFGVVPICPSLCVACRLPPVRKFGTEGLFDKPTILLDITFSLKSKVAFCMRDYGLLTRRHRTTVIFIGGCPVDFPGFRISTSDNVGTSERSLDKNTEIKCTSI